MSENIYMYDPKLNITTEVNIKYVADLLGVYPSAIRRKIKERSFVQSLHCYFLNKPLPYIEKRKIISEMKIGNEYWVESKYKGLFVSSEGRFRVIKDNEYEYRLPCKKHAALFIKHNYEIINVKKLMFETFNGPIPKGMTVDFVNGINNDIRASNLKLITEKAMRIKVASIARRKAVVHIDQQGKVIDEYVSVKEATENLYVSDHSIRVSCNGTAKRYQAFGYRAFMWADEYFGGGVHGIA